MNSWDKTKPLPSEYISTFYDYLRNFLELFEDRFGLDHNMNGVLDTTLPTADGYHNQLTMRDYEDVDEYSNPIYYPWYVEDSRQLFVKEIDGLHELCMQNSDGIYQVTKNAELSTGYYWDLLGVNSQIIYGMVYGNNLFVMVGGYGKIYTSPDAKTWTERTSGTTSKLLFVIYANGIFLAGGETGKLLSSSDGISWSLITLTTTQTLYAACFHDGLYVVASNSTSWKTSYSSDLINWYASPSLTTNTGLIYAFGLYIGVGVSGKIQTTPDLTLWTKRLELSFADGIYDQFFGIAYGNNILVTVGQYGKIYTSYDGISWTKRVSGIPEETGNTLTAISFFGGNLNKFCAVGSSGTILLSKDGIIWVQSNKITDYVLYSITNNNNIFLACGSRRISSPGKF